MICVLGTMSYSIDFDPGFPAMAKKDTGIFQFEKMDATFRCYQLRSVSGVLQAPSIEMEAEYTVLQVQPSDKVIDLFGDNPWAAGYQYLSVL